MRITAVQSFSISSTGQRIGNDKHNVQCTTSHLADNRELSSYSYGRDLISRKNPSFTAGEISKAGQLLANQIPVEEKLAKEQMMNRLGIYEKMENGTFLPSDMDGAIITQGDLVNAINDFAKQHKTSSRKPIGFMNK